VSINVVLSTLIIGGCVCVPSEWSRHNGIASAINELGVNIADLTSSVARLLSPETVPGLRILKLG
jgi:outer membrane murein-binding lipoprotein Lpp